MIGTRIRRLREEMGLSQNALARVMNVSPGAIHYQETEHTFPQRETLKRYAQALAPAMPPGVKPEAYILYGEEPYERLADGNPDWRLVARAQLGLSAATMRQVDSIVQALMLQQRQTD